MADVSWDDERVAKLTKLWLEGLSASQIAYRIGGVSRSAVIGKVYRLNLAKIRSENGKIQGARVARNLGASLLKRHTGTVPGQFDGKTGEREKRQYDKAAAAMNDLPPGDIGTARKGVADLERTDCRWPIGEPGHADFHFCAREKLDGISYCEFHAQKAFAAPVRRTGREFVDLQRKQRERKAS